MKIKIDIDNCIRNCAEPMVRLYNEKFNKKMTVEDIVDYDMDIAFPLLAKNGINAFHFFFVEHINETMVNAEPFEGVAEAIELLRYTGNTVTIVSYQPTYEAKIITLNWLNKHHIQYDNIAFTNEPTKVLVDCDVIIDDHMKYLNEVTPYTKTVCIDYPYNRSQKYDYRVKSISEYVNIKMEE